MSEENISDSSDETRRSFMKKGAAATVGTVAASGMASAQLDGGNETTTTPTDGGTTGGTGGETWEALLPASSFYPNAQFAVVSDTIESVPSYGDLQNVLTDYNMRLIRWQNTGEIAPLFVSQDVDVGQFDQDLGFVTAGGAGGTETPIEGGNETTTTTEEEDGALVGDNETTTEGGLGANDTGGNETGNDTGGLGGNETTTTTEGGGGLFGGLL